MVVYHYYADPLSNWCQRIQGRIHVCRAGGRLNRRHDQGHGAQRTPCPAIPGISTSRLTPGLRLLLSSASLRLGHRPAAGLTPAPQLLPSPTCHLGTCWRHHRCDLSGAGAPTNGPSVTVSPHVEVAAGSAIHQLYAASGTQHYHIPLFGGAPEAHLPPVPDGRPTETIAPSPGAKVTG